MSGPIRQGGVRDRTRDGEEGVGRGIRVQPPLLTAVHAPATFFACAVCGRECADVD